MKWIALWLAVNVAVVVLAVLCRKRRHVDLLSDHWLMQQRQAERETVRRGQ